MAYKVLEDLEVYNLAEKLSGEIWDIVSTWDFFAKDTVGKQLVRAVDSISANIAEGHGRFHHKDNKNFCYYARGSVTETKSWIVKSLKRNLIREEQYNMLLQQLNTIHFKLNAYIKQIGIKSTNPPTQSTNPLINQPSNQPINQ